MGVGGALKEGILLLISSGQTHDTFDVACSREHIDRRYIADGVSRFAEPCAVARERVRVAGDVNYFRHVKRCEAFDEFLGRALTWWVYNHNVGAHAACGAQDRFAVARIRAEKLCVRNSVTRGIFTRTTSIPTSFLALLAIESPIVPVPQ